MCWSNFPCMYACNSPQIGNGGAVRASSLADPGLSRRELRSQQTARRRTEEQCDAAWMPHLGFLYNYIVPVYLIYIVPIHRFSRKRFPRYIVTQRLAIWLIWRPAQAEWSGTGSRGRRLMSPCPVVTPPRSTATKPAG